MILSTHAARLGGSRDRIAASTMMLMAVTHVVLDKNTWWPSDSGWMIFSAWAAALAAVGTFVLAGLTWNLAKATKEMATKTADLAAQTATQVRESAIAIDQAERHHQQSLMPFVYVNATCRRVPNAQGGFDLSFEGHAINIGPGPALSLNLLVRPEGGAQRWCWVGPVSANTTVPISFRLSMTANSSRQVFPYDVLSVFQSVFVTDGYVRQDSSTGNGNDAIVRECIVASADEIKAKAFMQRMLDTTFAGPAEGAPYVPFVY